MRTMLTSLLSGTVFPDTQTVLAVMVVSTQVKNVTMEPSIPTQLPIDAEPTANSQDVEMVSRTELKNVTEEH
jgi:hypothetical protein